jgi:hypothetical protein
MITRIRIPSRYTCVIGATEASDAVEFNGTADFQLGPGPCGKTVERLEIAYEAYGLVVLQVCTCTEAKEFVYPWHTVTGRAEVTYA